MINFKLELGARMAMSIAMAVAMALAMVMVMAMTMVMAMAMGMAMGMGWDTSHTNRANAWQKSCHQLRAILWSFLAI